MKLIKISGDRVQIKTDSAHLKALRINDLLRLDDGNLAIVCIVTGLTGNDTMDIYDFDQEFLGQTASNSTIDCGILGSIVGGKFTKSIDVYPSTNVEISVVSDTDFANMLGVAGASSFVLGSYKAYGATAVVDGNKLFQRHFAILGNTGSGKSVTVASLLHQISKRKNSNAILFDLHGEYSGLDFVKTVKIGNGEMAFPMWFMPFKDIYSNIFRIKDESATVQLSVLRSAFNAARRSEATEDAPIAFSLDDVLDDIKSANTETICVGEYVSGDKKGLPKYEKGEFNGKLTTLVTLIEDRLLDRRYDFMCRQAPQEYLHVFLDAIFGISDKNIKVVDLSDAPHDMVPVIIAVITKLIYSVQLQQDRIDMTPLCIFCDEAHAYIPSSDFGLGASQRRLLEVFELIAKEGRKFGTTLCVASQRPSELNKTIMAQCANFIVMKMTNDVDKAMVKGVLPESSRAIIDTLSLFSAGDCFVIGDCVDITLKTRVDLPPQLPNSNTVDTWDVWGKEGGLDVRTLVDGLIGNDLPA